MYVQFKAGFIEADAWDGNQDLPAPHISAITEVSHREICVGDHALPPVVIVVRSRERETLARITHHIHGCEIFRTPSWDYKFRVYISAAEWGCVLAAIAADVDYRNFKSWCAANSTPARTNLAHDIWIAGRLVAEVGA